MYIGEVIRKYRKEKNMTQEEMAKRLGVTTPAVNKWENGNSFPDIMLLAPIARLLDISTDTLLSFWEDLTTEETNEFVIELSYCLKNSTYDEAYVMAKKKMEEYPNCEQLIWQLAMILDAQRMIKNIPDAEKYDAFILGSYERVLKSETEELRNSDMICLFFISEKKR